MASKLKRQEGHRLLAEILKTISHLEQSEASHMSSNNQATALNDHSFTHPTTSALTRVQLSGQKVNVAKELTTREKEIEVLGNEIDKLAVRISLGEPDYGVADKSGSMLSYTHAETFFRPPMMEAWEDVLKLEDCLKIHTKNAADYHVFHAEVTHRTKSLENFHKTAESRISTLKLTGTTKDGDKLRDVIQDAMQALNIQTARVHYLSQKALTIVPVHKRTEASRSPQAAVAVAHYRNRELQFIRDEDLILKDTTDDLLWRVIVKDGNTSLVPALLVLIPGPDYDALNAVKGLVTTLVGHWTWSLKYLGCLLLECLRRLLNQWSQHAGNYDALDKSQAQLLVKILNHSKEVLKLWRGTPLYNDVIKLIDAAIKKTNVTCSLSDDAIRKNKDKPLSVTKKDVNTFGEEIVYYAQLTGYHYDLEEAWRRCRLLLNLGDGDEFSMDSDEMSEYLRRNFGSEVPIDHTDTIEIEHTDTTESAETEDVTRSEQQQQQRLVISAITDPRDGTELGLDEAIKAGVLNMSTGLYINPKTKATKSIQEAMSEGLIQVTQQTTELSEEKVSTFGLIKLTTIRETRPYTITGVVDPKTDNVINLAEAHKKGIVDRASTEYHDTVMKIKMTIMDAVDVGLINVEFKDNGQESHQETEVKTYAVHGVVDRKTRRRLSFADAVDRGILDKEKGIYIDTANDTELFVGEAIQLGLVKARRVADNTSLDIDPENTMIVEKAGKAWNKLKAVRALGGLKKKDSPD